MSSNREIAEREGIDTVSRIDCEAEVNKGLNCTLSTFPERPGNIAEEGRSLGKLIKELADEEFISALSNGAVDAVIECRKGTNKTPLLFHFLGCKGPGILSCELTLASGSTDSLVSLLWHHSQAPGPGGGRRRQ